MSSTKADQPPVGNHLDRNSPPKDDADGDHHENHDDERNSCNDSRPKVHDCSFGSSGGALVCADCSPVDAGHLFLLLLLLYRFNFEDGEGLDVVAAAAESDAQRLRRGALVNGLRVVEASRGRPKFEGVNSVGGEVRQQQLQV